MMRSPICSVLGHVDHGKSSILDSIRGSAVTRGEAGGITQAIGASIIPLESLKKKIGALLDSLKMEFTIPGLLFIDTPGHAAFTSLRKRGGNLADIAILVIDINEGFKPQTEESVEILKTYKTPFIIAANKIDLVPGWKEGKVGILANINNQADDVKTSIEKKLYELVGQLHEKFGMVSERFDRVEDYTNQIAIVPCSAMTGEGIPELMMVITGLAQKFLEQCLECNVERDAKGTVLEVKEEKGLGTTLDVIIYDGSLKVNDTIVIGSIGEPIITKIRALLEPASLADMRDKKTKFKPIKEVAAAIGVKIAAPNISGVIAGMPIRSAIKEDVEKVKQEIQEEVEDVIIETEKEGIVIKADSLGSLEALINLLKKKNIPIRKATIGEITKKDIADAETNYEKNPLNSVILAFNLPVPEDIKAISKKVKIISNDIIYKIIENFEAWQEEEKKRQEAKELDLVIRPCKVQILQGYVFRQSNPAVVGVEVVGGTVKTGMPVMNIDGKELTSIKGIQQEQENIQKAEKGKQVALSMEGVTVGRQIKEGDILYSSIPEQDFIKMKKLKQYLSPDEIEVIKEIAEIKRRHNTVWGVG